MTGARRSLVVPYTVRGLIAAVCALVLMSVGAVATGAQTIQGTVQSDSQPVIGATVRLLELDRATRTGPGGQFTFPDVPSGTYRVYVALLGYAAATDTVHVSANVATVSFALKASAMPLKQIVVTASPTARTADDQYQSAESKSQVEFDNSPGMNYAEKIDDLPGVSARWNGSASARPILRGLGDNEVLVLENGLRMGTSRRTIPPTPRRSTRSASRRSMWCAARPPCCTGPTPLVGW